MKREYKKWTGEDTLTLAGLDWYYKEAPVKGAISRNTAAELYGFSELINMQLDFTVPRGYNSPKLQDDFINLKRNELEKYEFQIEQYEFENMVFNIYSPERTFVELIKEAKNNFTDVIMQVVKNFFSKVKYNYNKLIEAARVFKIEDQILAFEATANAYR